MWVKEVVTLRDHRRQGKNTSFYLPVHLSANGAHDPHLRATVSTCVPLGRLCNLLVPQFPPL